jgi:hypothetical protein
MEPTNEPHVSKVVDATLLEAEESSDEDGYSSSGFLTPDEYQISPPRHPRRLDEEDPEYDPSAEVELVL